MRRPLAVVAGAIVSLALSPAGFAQTPALTGLISSDDEAAMERAGQRHRGRLDHQPLPW